MGTLIFPVALRFFHPISLKSSLLLLVTHKSDNRLHSTIARCCHSAITHHHYFAIARRWISELGGSFTVLNPKSAYCYHFDVAHHRHSIIARRWISELSGSFFIVPDLIVALIILNQVISYTPLFIFFVYL